MQYRILTTDYDLEAYLISFQGKLSSKKRCLYCLEYEWDRDNWYEIFKI